MKDFIKNYTMKLIDQLNNINITAIQQIMNVIDDTDSKNGTIYIIGNGGSAATASHMANDLGVGLKIRNIKNLNVHSLADNTPICTAIANDVGYENIFYTQLKNVLKKDDLLIAISCSGKSPNIIKAVKYANSIECKVIGLSGFDGGELKTISDISFHIETQAGDYGTVEDMHMILDHIIFSYYKSQG